MEKIKLHPAQVAVAVLAAGLLVWFCLPGFFNAGTFLGVLLSVLTAAAAVFFRQLVRLLKWLWRHIPGRIAFCSLGAVIAGFLAYLGYSGAMMISYADRPLAQVNAVMILGCQVKGDVPGRELVNRLETALPLIERNPSAPVIVTGGRGRGEDISEGECMKAWLVGKGVDESRIYVECASHSTATNFTNSAPILEQLGVTDGIAVVTNDFHQYRSDIYARRLGLSVGHYSAPTRALVLPNYIIRELAALCFV